ncbi:hypothetical protein ACOMHN_009898 [Nucella lapillus]
MWMAGIEEEQRGIKYCGETSFTRREGLPRGVTQHQQRGIQYCRETSFTRREGLPRGVTQHQQRGIKYCGETSFTRREGLPRGVTQHQQRGIKYCGETSFTRREGLLRGRDGREGVMKEVERERMLRVDTEQRLQEMREESDSCRARLHALQEEFRKMEDMVRDMLQYKTKIDQLKQEKANLAATYESNVQKCRNHISTLERENMMLLNQVKKMEAQLHGKGDDRDKSRLLLERLKMVEGENSSLVLENEQQRQQYEKCLDQIANQVVQALLAQKTLREECLKLQNRVQDLELQNRQLNMMFQQRVRFPSDPTMQMPSTGGTTVYRAEGGEGEATNAQFLQGSAVSLQSMFSETMFEDAPGYPQMSTPPPWLRDRLELPLDDEISLSSSTSGSPSSPSQPPHPAGVATGAKSRPSPSASSLAIPVPGQTTKIETEFPATNASPKMKHINVSERGTRSLERRGEGSQKTAGFHPLICSVGPSRGSTGSVRKGKVRSSSETLAMNQLSEQAWQKLEAQVKGYRKTVQQEASSVKQSTSAEVIVSSAAAAQNPPAASQRPQCSPSSEAVGGTGKGQGQAGRDMVKSSPRKTGKNGKSPPQVSPLFTKVKLRRKGSNSSRDSSRSPHRSAVRNSMPPSMPHHSQYYYDYSDEDSDSRPVSRVYSCASTVSLNELLDTSGEGDFALDEDFFSDWSSMCLSPQHRLPIHPTNIHLHPSPPGQSLGSGQGPGSPARCVQASGRPTAHPYIRQLSHNFRENRQGGGNRAKTEREDSGCEVEASHSDRSESWPCNNGEGGNGEKCQRGQTQPVTAGEAERGVQAGVDSASDSSSARASLTSGQGSEPGPGPDPCGQQTSDSAAVVCTVSLPSKTVTRVRLPSPQAAVLIQQPAWSRSDSEQSPTSESSCAASPEKPPSSAASGLGSVGWSSPQPDREQQVSSNNGPGTSAADLPHTANTSTNRADVCGSTSKLKSKPLTAEEKSRACRPDQLILAPADKTVHGFTSSSSCSSEDKSPFPQTQPADSHPRQCSRTAGKVCPLEESPASSKPKRSPPAVPHKPSKPHPPANPFPSPGPVDVSTKSSSNVSNTDGSVGVSGISADGAVSSKKGAAGVGVSFPPETTLTVGFMSVEAQQLDQVARNPDTVRDFVNSLVRDMKERVARQSDWPITTTTTTPTSTSTTPGPLAYCKSLDSSFESLRAERSGSKDDGYSTMSSDIHPVAMDKYSYVDIVVAKPAPEVTSSVRKTPDLLHELSLVGSPKKRNKSIEASETDSAMETSAHSMDTRNSSHSLSSQVSSSSGENILSPVTKVTKMAQFFEEDSCKSSGSSTTTTTHPLSAGTLSPLSPSGECSLVSGGSSTCLSPSLSITSPESEGSFKQMYASVVAKLSPMPVKSGLSDSAQSLLREGVDTSIPSAAVSPTSSTASPRACSPVGGSVGQRIHDMVHSFQAGLKDKAGPSVCPPDDETSPGQPPSPSPLQGVTPEKISAPSLPHRPTDFRLSLERRMVRSPVCDFKKYEINDPSKRNMSYSPPFDAATRRENIMSWPPRKITPPLTPSPLSPVSYTSSPGWDTPSPLHVIEDKILDDIPEENSDESDGQFSCSPQELQPAPGVGEGRCVGSSGGSSPGVVPRSLKKCRSESSLCEKPRTMSLYDEMMTGSWDSGKVLERSASVSEVDFRPTQQFLEEQSYFHRSCLHFSFDETEIQEKVAALLQCSRWTEGGDSEAEVQEQLMDLWNILMAQRPASFPAHTSQHSTEAWKKDLPSSKATTTPVAKTSPRGKGVTSMDLTLSGLEGGQALYHTKPVEDKGEDSSDDDSRQSPSVTQKLFHSEFYSLCPVVSNRSLASSMGSMYQHSREQLDEDPPSFIAEGIHASEFEEISHQIASLSRTVDELNRSLNSLNSGGSKHDLQDSDDTEDGQGKEASGGGGAWSSSRQECIEGYHWVEDEFYLTSCGGEVIIGSAALLAEEEGMEDYCEGGGGEAGGGMFAMEDNDDAIADDAQDDFYCIRIPPHRERPVTGPPPVRPVSGGSDLDHIWNNLVHFRYNSDGQLSRQSTDQSNASHPGGMGWKMDSSCSHSSLSQALHATTSIITTPTTNTANRLGGEVERVGGAVGGGGGDGDSNILADREQRANMLDSMLPSGGESNDSLSSDIGLDHMMCQRLIGRKGKRDVVRFWGRRQRPALDLSHFFQHYSKMEQDAVAAFDFLEDISTSESTEHLDVSPDSATRRCRSSSQPLSREVVMRQAQFRQQRDGQCVTRTPPRPLSDSDFRKFRLPASQAAANSQAWQDQRYPSYYSYTPPPSFRPGGGRRGGRGVFLWKDPLHQPPPRLDDRSCDAAGKGRRSGTKVRAKTPTQPSRQSQGEGGRRGVCPADQGGVHGGGEGGEAAEGVARYQGGRPCGQHAVPERLLLWQLLLPVTP